MRIARIQVLKKTLGQIKKVCAKSALPLAVLIILLSYQNCGDVSLVSPEAILDKSCAELQESVPSYIQIGLVDGVTKAFINELIIGDSNEVIKSVRVYEWSLEGPSGNQSFQDSEINLPEIASGDCDTQYVVRAQISICDNTIQFEPVEYTNLNCATPTPTPNVTPTATPAPTATPPPTVTTTIPGWTNVPPSPNSCPMGGGGTLPTSPEPQIPLACLTIPGRDAARPYPQVYLGFDELENGGFPPFGDPPEFMPASWWNANNNNGIFTRDMSWTHVDQAPRVCEANSQNIPLTLSYLQYFIVTDKYYSIRISPSAGEAGLIYLENSNGEPLVGTVSISECPGDFGEIHDPSLMQIINGGSQQSLPTPPVNSRNTNRTLFYQAAGEKTYNQYIPPSHHTKYYPFERCIMNSPRRGSELAFKTTDTHGDSRVNRGCRLQAGKTYYINMVTVNGYTNKQVYPGPPSAQAVLVGITPY